MPSHPDRVRRNYDEWTRPGGGLHMIKQGQGEILPDRQVVTVGEAHVRRCPPSYWERALRRCSLCGVTSEALALAERIRIGAHV